ncbi:glycosyltransferase family A protein [Phenylobacterium sp. LjRoot225]|uniref:glycosyltransferase family 2 protein n=1 Tax=Phenylobacterium sp. LjRoot225 TaxID=3342285 RepID=UPI003ECC932F
MKTWPKIETPVVTVVIPAYNAQATLAETLESALAQNCRDIEVIVVDDGSSDQTVSIAEAYAARDRRVRLVGQANGGVARARNRGVAEARAAYVAPLDADDLWHPAKLERQLRTLQAAGPNVGLVYSWTRLIDAEGRVTGAQPPSYAEGYVLHRHLAWNFVGNGSTPLIPTELLRRHPYDPALRDAHRGGGEDYLLQLLLAQRHIFACAPGFLTGYRKTARTMSSDTISMVRSVSMVFALLDKQLSGFARHVARRRRADYLLWEAGHHLGARDWPQAAHTLLDAGRCAPSVTMRWLVNRGLKRSLRRVEQSGAADLGNFHDQDPDVLDQRQDQQLSIKVNQRLSRADLGYGRYVGCSTECIG